MNGRDRFQKLFNYSNDFENYLKIAFPLAHNRLVSQLGYIMQQKSHYPSSSFAQIR
jgi:hypothetical protein